MSRQGKCVDVGYLCSWRFGQLASVQCKVLAVDGFFCFFCTASHLTTILQGTGTQLSRSVSSAGEHVSMSYVNLLMPKRAETFAGFDTTFEAPKREFSVPYLG